MDDLVRKLIIRICLNSRENRIPICVTRATKLMYLIEWEYFAWERKPATSLSWIYLHYGPWSPELSDIFQQEFSAPPEKEEPSTFRQVFWTPPQFDRVDTRLPYELEGIVQRVFETFGSMPTQDIIRYAYFNTEPMQHAERRQRLDFTMTRKPLKPFSAVSTLGKRKCESIRDRLRAATQAKLAEKTEVSGDVSLEIMGVLSQFDSSGDFMLPEGEIKISPDDRFNIAEEG